MFVDVGVYDNFYLHTYKYYPKVQFQILALSNSSTKLNFLPLIQLYSSTLLWYLHNLCFELNLIEALGHNSDSTSAFYQHEAIHTSKQISDRIYLKYYQLCYLHLMAVFELEQQQQCYMTLNQKLKLSNTFSKLSPSLTDLW